MSWDLQADVVGLKSQLVRLQAELQRAMESSARNEAVAAEAKAAAASANEAADKRAMAELQGRFDEQERVLAERMAEVEATATAMSESGSPTPSPPPAEDWAAAGVVNLSSSDDEAPMEDSEPERDFANFRSDSEEEDEEEEDDDDGHGGTALEETANADPRVEMRLALAEQDLKLERAGRRALEAEAAQLRTALVDALAVRERETEEAETEGGGEEHMVREFDAARDTELEDAKRRAENAERRARIARDETDTLRFNAQNTAVLEERVDGLERKLAAAQARAREAEGVAKAAAGSGRMDVSFEAEESSGSAELTRLRKQHLVVVEDRARLERHALVAARRADAAEEAAEEAAASLVAAQSRAEAAERASAADRAIAGGAVAERNSLRQMMDAIQAEEGAAPDAAAQITALLQANARLETALAAAARTPPPAPTQAPHTPGRTAVMRQADLQDRIVALEAERRDLNSQVATLEERVGDGEFNPRTTKVLHAVANPRTAAMRERFHAEKRVLLEEIASLRQRLSTSIRAAATPARGGASTSMLGAVPMTPGVESEETVQVVRQLRMDLDSATKQARDVEVGRQRLRAVFQSKITEFREACYTLTGFRVDMVSSHEYRLWSQFAAARDDCLVFRRGADGVVTLLGTSFSESFSPAIHRYLTEHHSIPAFVAAAQLDLISRQTQAIRVSL